MSNLSVFRVVCCNYPQHFTSGSLHTKLWVYLCVWFQLPDQTKTDRDLKFRTHTPHEHILNYSLCFFDTVTQRGAILKSKIAFAWIFAYLLDYLVYDIYIFYGKKHIVCHMGTEYTSYIITSRLLSRPKITNDTPYIQGDF